LCFVSVKQAVAMGRVDAILAGQIIGNGRWPLVSYQHVLASKSAELPNEWRLPPNRGQDDLRLTRESGWRYGFAQG
jgi:hypothetical protein